MARPSRHALKLVISVVLVCAAIAIPAYGSNYLTHVATVVLIYVPLAVGQNLILGNSGQLSLGHAAFYGIGAYTTAIFTLTFGWPAAGAITVAILACALAGLVVGVPAIRVSGDYLFIVTIGLNLVFIDVVNGWTSVTGGASGLVGVPYPSFGPVVVNTATGFYLMAAAIASISITVAVAVTRSRFGRVIEAVRDDVIAARSSGIRITRIRVSVFILGAAMAGLSGGVASYFLGFVGPGDFGVDQSLIIFEMAILGGLGAVQGSVLGAILMIGVPEFLRFLQPVALGLGGLLTVVMMVVRPQGILGRVNVVNLIRK
jgi:branched-chain amino acid transport system permease protein